MSVGYTDFTWQSPNGTTLDLLDDAGNLWVQPGVSGLGAAARTVIADALPLGGSLVRSLIPQPRMITLPLFLGADDPTSFITAWRALIEAFTCTDRLGPGILVVTRYDGTARQIPAYYYAGLEGDAETGLPHQSLALQLYCPDPFWQSSVTTYLPFSSSIGQSYLAPYLTVSGAQILGTATVVISGSQPAYPVWTFSGPFTGVTVSNGTQSFTITGSAAAGEVWTVNTNPSALTAVSSSGANLMPFLNWPNAVFWQLAPGINTVTLTLGGTTSASSAVLAYAARSETA